MSRASAVTIITEPEWSRDNNAVDDSFFTLLPGQGTFWKYPRFVLFRPIPMSKRGVDALQKSLLFHFPHNHAMFSPL